MSAERIAAAAMRQTATLHDMLHNLAPDSGANPDYCRGMQLATMALLPHTVLGATDWEDNMETMVDHFPNRVANDKIHAAWREDIVATMILFGFRHNPVSNIWSK